MIKIKKIKPMFTKIVTTANKYLDDDAKDANGIIDVSKMKTGLTEYQTVLAVGSYVKDIEVGDVVCINPDRYKVNKYRENSMKADIMENTVVRYNFPMVNLDGQDCLLLDSADVEFVVEEYE